MDSKLITDKKNKTQIIYNIIYDREISIFS